MEMSRLKYFLPVAVLACATLLTTTTLADLKIGKLEKRPCVACHTSIKGKELNRVGKCYKEKRSMEACEG